jgi:hypothetical protein
VAARAVEFDGAAVSRRSLLIASTLLVSSSRCDPCVARCNVYHRVSNSNASPRVIAGLLMQRSWVKEPASAVQHLACLQQLHKCSRMMTTNSWPLRAGNTLTSLSQEQVPGFWVDSGCITWFEAADSVM